MNNNNYFRCYRTLWN